MKKTLIITLLLLMAILSGRAQERIFVITDRNTYIAGDMVFCSVYALDDKGRQTGFSAVSYLELISAEGSITEAKIGMFNGRGAGSFRIPAGAPTGNYRLMGYTARSAASVEYSQVLTVFNTSSTARVKDGVAFVGDSELRPASRAGSAAARGDLGISFPVRMQQGKEAILHIASLEQDANLVVSVFHDDDLPHETPVTIAQFAQEASASSEGSRSAEYEGEIIYASVEGLEADGESDNNPEHVTAFLSTAGSPENIYVGKPAGNGQVRFYTGNIYGDRELVCEVVSMYGKKCHINLKSPFTRPSPGTIPVLKLNASERGDLVSRKASLKDSAPLDTLVEFLPKREDLLLAGQPFKRYHLDDYTRFPTIKETCTEFIPELKMNKSGSSWRLRLTVSDATSSRHYQQDNILVLMDGVVITDHGMLANFDATLLEDIDLYQQAVAMGSLSFNGVVNFVSKKNYVTALPFPDNTRVIDFKGVSYPVAYLGQAPSGKDLRQLLYWHPSLELSSHSDLRIPIKTPDYSGKFRIVIQGTKANGTPLYEEFPFEVE